MRGVDPDAILRLARERGGKVLGVNLDVPQSAPQAEVPRAEAATRRTKHGNVRTAYDGVTYDSKAEARYAQWLDARLEAGEIVGWTRQVRFTLGVPENTYKVDFLVFDRDGRAEAVEVKGHRTDRFNKNVKLWRRYGPCPLLIVDGKGDEVETILGKGR